MKKTLLIISLVLATCVVTGYFFRQPLGEAHDAWTTRNMFVSVDAAKFNPGPAIGSRFPGLRASQQGRSVTLIDEFARGNGTILIALRSLDWCPYCKRQMIQLQEYKAYFHAAGIGLVAITYDSPEAQQLFIEQHAITIPVLSDDQSMSFRTLGILDEDYQPTDSEYGIPHPGMIIIDREGVVAGKLFVETPELRVDSAEALRYAMRVLGLKDPFSR
jgi:peroxiredoxin